jgi:hypothetical protein
VRTIAEPLTGRPSRVVVFIDRSIDTVTQAAPARKKSKIGRPRIERVQHVIEIQDWRWDYMFGIDDTSFREGPYFDFRHL